MAIDGRRNCTVEVRSKLFFTVGAGLATLVLLQAGCGDYEASQPSRPSAPAAAAATPGEQPAAVAGNLPTWQSDKAFEEQLGPYQDAGDYQIRVPKGYDLPSNPPKAPPGGTMLFWRQRRDDGSISLLSVVVATPSAPPDFARLTIEQMVNQPAEGLRKETGDVQQGPVEGGIINGLRFLRNQYQGTPRESPRKMYACTYACKDGGVSIIVAARDEESHQDTLKLLTAAIMTFRKK
jgi:hypothetical protein